MVHTKRSPHLKYHEQVKLEPVLREQKEQTDVDLAIYASKLLGRAITWCQVREFRQEIGLGRPVIRRLLTKDEVLRLEEMLRVHDHVVVHKGPKRVYLIPFERALTMRDRFVAGKVWQKTAKAINGEVHGVARTS